MENTQVDFIATKTVYISASIEKVWNALVDPVQIKKYLFNTDTKTDWKVGSPITFAGSWEGKNYQDKGIILAIKPPKLLKYSYWSSMSGKQDAPENYAVVTFKLQQEKSLTIVILTQDNNSSEESRNHSEENWGKVLEGLKKVVEG